jgi:hypothetical protein
VEGRFRYSDLKEAAPGDYGICIWMRRSLSFASVPLLSECLGFSSGSQREWAWGGASETLERTTKLRSDQRETQNRCGAEARARFEAGWGFMLRTGGDSAEI